MPPFSRPACAPLGLLLGCTLAMSGCGGVREDRTITFSAGGDQVGFQHGGEGVFVADKEGGAMTKIFAPDKDVIAVGTPLWAPNDRRLIFTTARRLPNNGGAPVLLSAAEDPAGRVFGRQPVVYTCWLRDEPQGGVAPAPRPLFTAEVDHVGYVAAGLAVRWHPKGDRILYVRRVGAGHAVFEFDLAGRASRRVFPGAEVAADVVFDWSPDGSHLVCLIAGGPFARHRDGIWVGREGADWWHLEVSAPLDGSLEGLKAARPAWTKDGRRFAFTSSLPAGRQGEPDRHFLWLATLDGRRVERLLEEKEPMRDLLWHPDGRRLGFLTGRDGGLLRVTNCEDAPLTVAPQPVRTFAGWDATGERLAYTTADDVPLKDEGGFSLLLFPDPLARDALWVAPGDGRGEARALVSGLRTTFVRWSPRDETLSQWFTFSPTHRSIPSLVTSSGLRPGDPAAVLDATTGKISWVAVNGREKAQVGHYHLLKRHYAEAWHWYEQADRDQAANPDPESVNPAGSPFRDFSFFEYYCLDKLGRRDEARARLAAFRAGVARLLPPQGGREGPMMAAVARDFYAAEAFFSLDAAEDGEAFFRQALAGAKTDEDRLSAALVLSQVLLVEGRYGDYATVTTEEVAPRLLKSWQPQPGADVTKFLRGEPPSAFLGALGVLPLSRSDLLTRVPDDRLPRLLSAWTELRARAPDDLFALGSGLVLEGLYRRVGRLDLAGQARQRSRAILGRAGLPAELDGDRANSNIRMWIDVMRAFGPGGA